jgi:hypothetical protein
MRTLTFAGGLLLFTALLSPTPAEAGATRTGPDSSDSPYLLPTAKGVKLQSILTVGDAAENGYRMVGKPDGLGAFDNYDGTFTLLMNHELPRVEGVIRRHGHIGAFVSRWIIDSDTLEVRSGEDLARQVLEPSETGGWAPIVLPMNRLCSADLPRRGAFYDEETGAGTTARLFLNGEEGVPGRAFAHVVDGPDAGSSYRLESLGRADWENQVTMPDTGAATVVVGTDDSLGGQVYVYVGQKQTTGLDIERAGLVGGRLYGVVIDGIDNVVGESDSTTLPEGGAPFRLVEIPGASEMNIPQLDRASQALGVSRMARPEDSAWHTVEPGGLYFATTAGVTAISRLWHLTFSDPSNVTAGGVAEIAVAGPAYDPLVTDQAGPRAMDNITVDRKGRVLIQEDSGNEPYLSGIYQYDPATGALQRIATHDPGRFLPQPGSDLMGEESSGIIPARFLGSRRFLLTSMWHQPTNDVETFERGQLLLMKVPGRRVR